MVRYLSRVFPKTPLNLERCSLHGPPPSSCPRPPPSPPQKILQLPLRIHPQRIRPLHLQRQKRRNPPPPPGSDHRAPRHRHGSRARPAAADESCLRPQCPSPPGMETHAAIAPPPIPHRYLPQPLP